jgi:hypothetical protein
MARPPLEDRGQEDGVSTTTNAACTVAAAAAITVNKQLTAAESAMAQATSHHELMRALVNQARVVSDEATRAHTAAHETLAAAHCTYAAAINNVNIATANESQCIAELNTADMDTVALAPTWALNPFAADDSSRQKDSWNLLRNALTFMLKTGRTKRVA